MPIATSLMPIAASLAARINTIATHSLEYTDSSGVKFTLNGLIPDFGLFIDTHRDQPHVGSFHDDIHRGFSRPTRVDYSPGLDMLIEQNTGQSLARKDKHMFVTDEWFASFLLERMMSGLSDPRDGDGMLATSHLRDARAKVYHLKSFRQIVMDRYYEELSNGPRPLRPR